MKTQKIKTLSIIGIVSFILFCLTILIDFGTGLFFFLILACSTCLWYYEKKKENAKSTTQEESGQKEIIDSSIKDYLKAISIPYIFDYKGVEYFLNYKYENIGILKPEGSTIDIKVGEELKLVQEPDNQYDNRAVAILNLKDEKVGYLYKGWLQDMVNDFIKKDDPFFVLAEREPFKSIIIGFYKRTPKNSMFKLTGNFKQEMHENISLCSVGDQVDLDYNDEKDNYEVTSQGLEIGYVSSSKINNNSYEAYIHDIQENDNDKYIVTIVIL